MVQYRNVGKGPWRRPTGELVAAGDTFEATVRELQRITRRGYVGRLERVPPISEEQEEQDVLIETRAEWTLRMSPEMYLKLHPSGGHAPLARQLVEAAVGAAAGDTA